jgi:EAL domain-containing protein (putative c-di-GMP-specific phosphodiesterase class I)
MQRNVLIFILDNFMGNKFPSSGDQNLQNKHFVLRSYLHFNNFDIISIVYGSTVAETALLDIINFISDVLGACGAVERVYRQSLQITVWDMRHLSKDTDLGAYLLSKIAFRLNGDADSRFCFSVTALDSCHDATSRRPSLSIPVTAPANPDETSRYINNMLDAVGILTAISTGRLKILLVPINGFCDGQASADHEIDPRIAMDGGVLRRIAFWRSLFEELGLIQILDYHIAMAAASEVRADKNLRATLYVSPSCLRADTWGRMFGQIFCDPDISGRFAIGVCHSAFFNRTDVDLGLIAQIRDAGNGIAIDEFDAGTQSCRDLSVLEPNIVKMDAAWVRHNVGHIELADAIRLAREVATDVVTDCFDNSDGHLVDLEADPIWKDIKFIYYKSYSHIENFYN